MEIAYHNAQKQMLGFQSSPVQWLVVKWLVVQWLATPCICYCSTVGGTQYNTMVQASAGTLTEVHISHKAIESSSVIGVQGTE